MSTHLLAGCSFTDPKWQTVTPWSVQYSQKQPSYIVAKAGMGIRGICTEALYYLKELADVTKVILVLPPSLWRMDIEVDHETYLCNAMVDNLYAENGVWKIQTTANRKWIVSGGLHYDKKTEYGKIFEMLYKHQGFLVVLKEHVRALRTLIDYCKSNNISYHITAGRDPMDQLQGLEYVQDQIECLLEEAEYNTWFKFDNKFIDKFLEHDRHPDTKEHEILCKYIFELTN
jgi:hypothetical protein